MLLRGLGMEKKRALGLARRTLPPMPNTRLRDEVINNGLELANLEALGIKASDQPAE